MKRNHRPITTAPATRPAITRATITRTAITRTTITRATITRAAITLAAITLATITLAVPARAQTPTLCIPPARGVPYESVQYPDWWTTPARWPSPLDDPRWRGATQSANFFRLRVLRANVGGTDELLLNINEIEDRRPPGSGTGTLRYFFVGVALGDVTGADVSDCDKQQLLVIERNSGGDLIPSRWKFVNIQSGQGDYALIDDTADAGSVCPEFELTDQRVDPSGGLAALSVRLKAPNLASNTFSFFVASRSTAGSDPGGADNEIIATWPSSWAGDTKIPHFTNAGGLRAPLRAEWGELKPEGGGCTGITITRDDIGVTQVTDPDDPGQLDPDATPLGGTSISGCATKSNSFLARLRLNGAASVKTGDVTARFRIADWGSTPLDNGTWGNVGGLSQCTRVAIKDAVPGSSFQSFTTSCRWTLTDAQRTDYGITGNGCGTGVVSGNLRRHQCILVDLTGSPAADVYLQQDSAYRNMNLLAASTVRRDAVIETSRRGTELLLHVHRANMPAFGLKTRRQDPFKLVDAKLAALRKRKLGSKPNDTHAKLLGRYNSAKIGEAKDIDAAYGKLTRVLAPDEMEAVLPTVVVNVYRATGKRFMDRGKPIRAFVRQPRFGLHALHKGLIRGWHNTFKGKEGGQFEQLPGTKDWYRLKTSAKRSTLNVSVVACEKDECAKLVKQTDPVKPVKPLTPGPSGGPTVPPSSGSCGQCDIPPPRGADRAAPLWRATLPALLLLGLAGLRRRRRR